MIVQLPSGPVLREVTPQRPLLIDTKMHPPRLPPRLVSRAAPLALLHAGLDQKLTVLAAPAGFGKTTLLGDWCRQLRDAGLAVAWVSVDADDDELEHFAAYVTAAVTHAVAALGGHAAPSAADDPMAPSRRMQSMLVNDVASLDGRVVLVLDDVDRLASPAIHEALFRVLRYAPENLHVVLAGRSVPAVPLSYFRVREQLTMIDASELRFGVDEARDFFGRSGGASLTTDETQQIVEATEGWVAGLQLAALALRGTGGAARVTQSLAEAGRAIDAYLAENVLAGVPEEVSEFLLATSVLERLEPALCNAVTGRSDAHKMLDWLEAHNLFIRPLDGGGTWFRYHALFREHLLRRLSRIDAARVPALHDAASRWFASQGLWTEAVRHALAAGQADRAADWVEQCAMGLVEKSDARTVLAWVSKLPEGALAGRTRLRLTYAWALAMTVQLDAARRELQFLQETIEAQADKPDERLRGEMLGVSAVVAALADDSVEALRLGEEIARSRPQEGSWVAEMGATVLIYGHMYAARFAEVDAMKAASAPFPSPGRPVHAQVYRRGVYGLSAWLAGDLRESARLFEEALAYAESAAGRQSAAAALPAGYLIPIMLEWNRLERVPQLLDDRLEIATEANSISSVSGMFLGAARLAALNADTDQARRLLDQATALGARRGWLRMVATMRSEAVRLDIAQGRLAQATQVVEALEAQLPLEPPAYRCTLGEAWHTVRVTRCRLLLARGQPGEAAALLQAEVADAKQGDARLRAARAEILLALALSAAGRSTHAQEALASALRYGQAQGMLRSVVDEGDAALHLVEECRRRAPEGVHAWYLDELLAAFGSVAPAAAVSPQASAASRLSAREVEILDFIAQGLSNKEIARALTVAPETIKWHLKNIYEKLNVSTRVQAVQCGLGLDLPVKARESVTRSARG